MTKNYITQDIKFLHGLMRAMHPGSASMVLIDDQGDVTRYDVRVCDERTGQDIARYLYAFQGGTAPKLEAALPAE